MKVGERYTVHKRVYPFANKLNPKLHQIILDNATIDDKGARMTSWKSYGIKEFNLICTWIRNFLLSSSLTRHDDLILRDYDLWGQLYNEGSYQVPHDHLPAHWSFVYYVNTPRGSSPLVFTTTGKRIKAEDGKVLIFPSTLFHHVPINKCDDRITYAGNIWPIEE